jgi:hypothetical protein
MAALVSVFSGTRRWSHRLLCLWAWLAVAPFGRGTAAEPSAAPLDEIKDDLKEIKRGESPGLAGQSAGPKIAVPEFIPTEPDSTLKARLSTPPTDSTKGKKRRGADWLLDAMELQAKAQQGKRSEKNEPGDLEKPLPDASDPEYLLKLYLAQEPPKADRAGATVREKDRGIEKLPLPGLFDDFLQRWISPRDRSLLGIRPLPQTDGTDSVPSFMPAPASLPPETAPAASSLNPFLSSLNLSAAPAEPPGGMAPLMNPPAVPPGGNFNTGAPFQVAPPPLPSNEAEKRPELNPPPNPADEKKYFPQLERF